MKGVVYNHGYTCALLLETRKFPRPVSMRRVLLPLLSSCLVCFISVEAFLLLLLFIDPERIKSNMAQGERVKGMETQVASSERGTDGSCRSIPCIATGVNNKDLAFMTTGPSLMVEHC